MCQCLRNKIEYSVYAQKLKISHILLQLWLNGNRTSCRPIWTSCGHALIGSDQTGPLMQQDFCANISLSNRIELP